MRRPRFLFCFSFSTFRLQQEEEEEEEEEEGFPVFRVFVPFLFFFVSTFFFVLLFHQGTAFRSATAKRPNQGQCRNTLLICFVVAVVVVAFRRALLGRNELVSSLDHAPFSRTASLRSSRPMGEGGGLRNKRRSNEQKTTHEWEREREREREPLSTGNLLMTMVNHGSNPPPHPPLRSRPIKERRCVSDAIVHRNRPPAIGVFRSENPASRVAEIKRKKKNGFIRRLASRTALMRGAHRRKWFTAKKKKSTPPQ